MKNIIIVNGQSIELSNEQIEKLRRALGVKVPKKEKEIADMFARAELGETFYYIGGYGKVYNDKQLAEDEIDYDEGGVDSEILFENANYCLDENIMKQRSMHEMLNRRLWRYAQKHVDTSKEYIEECYTIYHDEDGILEVKKSDISICQIGSIYFDDEEVANKALKEIVLPFLEQHRDFKW